MKTLQSIQARTGEALGAPLLASTSAQVDAAASAAAQAFEAWAASTGETRGNLLRGLASALEADREGLVSLADEETGLGPNAAER